MQQMMDNLATIKKLTKEWGKKHKLQFQKELRESEKRFEELYNSNTSNTFSAKSLQALKIEKKICNSLLDKEEQHWHTKSRALWLEVEDNNTKFFHRFTMHRKNINTILEIKDDEGNIAKSFHDKAKEMKNQFQARFKAPTSCSISEILEVLTLFPCLIKHEMRKYLVK